MTSPKVNSPRTPAGRHALFFDRVPDPDHFRRIYLDKKHTTKKEGERMAEA